MVARSTASIPKNRALSPESLWVHSSVASGCEATPGRCSPSIRRVAEAADPLAGPVPGRAGQGGSRPASSVAPRATGTVRFRTDGHDRDMADIMAGPAERRVDPRSTSGTEVAQQPRPEPPRRRLRHPHRVGVTQRGDGAHPLRQRVGVQHPHREGQPGGVPRQRRDRQGAPATRPAPRCRTAARAGSPARPAPRPPPKASRAARGDRAGEGERGRRPRGSPHHSPSPGSSRPPPATAPRRSPRRGGRRPGEDVHHHEVAAPARARTARLRASSRRTRPPAASRGGPPPAASTSGSASTSSCGEPGRVCARNRASVAAPVPRCSARTGPGRSDVVEHAPRGSRRSRARGAPGSACRRRTAPRRRR